jgi:hypothetical protein
VASTGYGLLLSKWDKRLATGTELSQQAAELLATVPSVELPAGVEGGMVKIPLSGMIQLPVL